MSDELLRCTRCADVMGFIPKTLPITYFGNSLAPVGLLSINPSFHEFRVPPNGTEPPFYLLESPNRTEATANELDVHVNRQKDYFNSEAYYETWFSPVEDFLLSIGTKPWGPLSFGIHGQPNVVHLDIVKCATQPKWRELDPASVQRSYIKNCSSHFLEQLNDLPLQVLIVNGSSVYTSLKRSLQKTYVRKEKCNESFQLSNKKWTEAEDNLLYDEMQIRILGGKTKIGSAREVSLTLGVSPEKCVLRYNQLTKRGIRTGKRKMSDTCTIYCEVWLKPKSGRSIVVVGTSQRISPDDNNTFRVQADRKYAAQVIQNYINHNVPIHKTPEFR